MNGTLGFCLWPGPLYFSTLLPTLLAAAQNDLFSSVREKAVALLGTRLRTALSGDGQEQWAIGPRVTFQLCLLPDKGEAAMAASIASEKDLPVIWVAECFSDAVGGQLRSRHQCYADAAGNAWLCDAAADALVLVQGQPRPPATTAGFSGSFLRARAPRTLLPPVPAN